MFWAGLGLPGGGSAVARTAMEDPKRNGWQALVGATIRSVAVLSVAAGIGLTGVGLFCEPSHRPANAQSCEACLRASDLDACHRVALDLAAQRDYQSAIAIEEGIQARLPGSSGIAASLARMYQLGTPNTARAIALYHAALHATPGYAPALMGLGSVMQDKGELEIAGRYYARAVHESPGQPLFKVRLAEVLQLTGRDAEAQPLLQEVLARWPKSDEAASARKLLSRTTLARP